MQVVVYIKDVDALGIVYHPRYIEWAASAREQYFRDLDLSFSLMQSNGFNMVTAKMCVNFKKNVKLGEVLEVKTLVSEIKLDRLIFSQKIINESKLLVAKIDVTSVAVDSDTKNIIKIPSMLINKVNCK